MHEIETEIKQTFPPKVAHSASDLTEITPQLARVLIDNSCARGGPSRRRRAAFRDAFSPLPRLHPVDQCAGQSDSARWNDEPRGLPRRRSLYQPNGRPRGSHRAGAVAQSARVPENVVFGNRDVCRQHVDAIVKVPSHLLLVKGVPSRVMAQLMGHANVDTTLNVYTQVLDGALRTAVVKIGSELFTIAHAPEGPAASVH